MFFLVSRYLVCPSLSAFVHCVRVLRARIAHAGVDRHCRTAGRRLAVGVREPPKALAGPVYGLPFGRTGVAAWAAGAPPRPSPAGAEDLLRPLKLRIRAVGARQGDLRDLWTWLARCDTPCPLPSTGSAHELEATERLSHFFRCGPCSARAACRRTAAAAWRATQGADRVAWPVDVTNSSPTIPSMPQVSRR